MTYRVLNTCANSWVVMISFRSKPSYNFFYCDFLGRLAIAGLCVFKTQFWRRQTRGRLCIWLLIVVREKVVFTSSAQVLKMPAKFTIHFTAGGLMAIWWQSSTWGPNDTSTASQIRPKPLFHSSHPTTSDYLYRPSSGNPLSSIFKLMKQSPQSLIFVYPKLTRHADTSLKNMWNLSSDGKSEEKYQAL